jgi:hypothetical protein
VISVAGGVPSLLGSTAGVPGTEVEPGPVVGVLGTDGYDVVVRSARWTSVKDRDAELKIFLKKIFAKFQTGRTSRPTVRHRIGKREGDEEQAFNWDVSGKKF